MTRRAQSASARTLWNWFDAYARIGVAGLPKARRSSRYAFNALCLIGGITAIGYTLFYFASGLPEVGVFAIGVCGILFCPWIAKRYEGLAGLFGISMVVCCFTAMTYLAGRESLLHLFILLGMINGMMLWGIRRPVFMGLALVATCVAIAISQVVFIEPALGNRVSDDYLTYWAAANLVATALMAFAVLSVLSLQVSQAQDALAAEHARSEALLMNLLPEDIAARLKDRPGEVIADGLPAVTLLFADIVDFTPRAASRTPEDVVAFLNSVFSRFDELTAERGLEKIKTIGDAYMVAAGLPVARDDHAQVIADMALAMRGEVLKLSEQMGEEVQLRVGIHSGPAIAGVIGTSKVFYDVWGDTVNTASRMESHGEVGRIQLTAETKNRLGDAYQFTERGPVDIKGKGRINTFWLIGKTQEG